MIAYEEQNPYDEFENMPMFDGPDANLDLMQGITNNGFEKPSEIQRKTIVELHNRRNVIGQAQSGRGKTGAFVIGSLSNLDTKKDAVQIIILANTHELATQIKDVVCSIGCKMIKSNQVELCIGRQISPEENIGHIRHGARILVGTPGRIKHLVKHQVNGKPLINPYDVNIVVLDEADCLLMNKFRDVVIDIIDTLDPPDRKPLQLAIFSATFSKESLDISRKLCVPNLAELGDSWREDPNAPVEVLIPVEELTLEGIQQYYYEIETGSAHEGFGQKADFIITLNDIQMIPMCIIYVNTKDAAIKLKNFLNNENLASQCIYGSMPASDRSRIIQSFRKCEIRILVSTDLLARGFDVQQVELVINFDLPYVHDRHTAEINEEKMAEYLHRIGRGGRFGRRGLAINLVASASERSRKEAIETYFDTKIGTLPDDITGLY